MKTLLQKQKEDSSKVYTLNRLSLAFKNRGVYKTADSFANAAMQLAEKIGYKKGQSDAYRCLGTVQYEQGNYEEALKDEDKGLQLLAEIKDTVDMGVMYGYIGLVYFEQGNYPLALQNQFNSLKIAEQHHDTRSLGSAYGNIGNIYYTQGNYDEAIKYMQDCVSELKAEGNKQNLAVMDMDLGLAYFDKGNHEDALKNMLQSMDIFKELGDKRGLAAIYSNIGLIYDATNNDDEAVNYLHKSMAISSEINDIPGVASDYSSLGSILVKQKKYAQARVCLDSGLALANSIGSKDYIRDLYINLSGLDSATGDYRAAFDLFKKAIVYRDSLKNEENTKKMVSEQMQYEFDKKQATQKAEQDKKDAIRMEQVKKQRIVIYAVTVGLVLVLLLAITIFRSLQQNRKKTEIIVQQKAEVEKKNVTINHQKAVVEQKNREILDSITYAKRLQDAILPPLSIVKKYLPESFVLYRPKDIVAGDFYWMERAGDVILIAACDCTGHGVPGAMVSVVCSNALNRTVKEFKITEPGKILDKVRELVLETFEKSEGDVKDGMDVSFCAINTKTGNVEWSGAYNPLWYITNNELKEITADKQPIGKYDKPISFSTHSLNLKKGDTVYLFTDGYADQFGGPKGKKFKYKQLQDLLVANAYMTMDEQKKLLERTLEHWQGNLEQVDDVLVMGIRV